MEVMDKIMRRQACTARRSAFLTDLARSNERPEDINVKRLNACRGRPFGLQGKLKSLSKPP